MCRYFFSLSRITCERLQQPAPFVNIACSLWTRHSISRNLQPRLQPSCLSFQNTVSVVSFEALSKSLDSINMVYTWHRAGMPRHSVNTIFLNVLHISECSTSFFRPSSAPNFNLITSSVYVVEREYSEGNCFTILAGREFIMNSEASLRFRCSRCSTSFNSSQGLAGHIRACKSELQCIQCIL